LVIFAPSRGGEILYMFTPIQDLFLTKVEKIYRIEYKEDLPKDWVDKLDLRIIQISKRYLLNFFPIYI